VGQKDKAITFKIEWLSKLEVANAITIFHIATVKYGEEKKCMKMAHLCFVKRKIGCIFINFSIQFCHTTHQQILSPFPLPSCPLYTLLCVTKNVFWPKGEKFDAWTVQANKGMSFEFL
jgi:hypothetical protein